MLFWNVRCSENPHLWLLGVCMELVFNRKIGTGLKIPKIETVAGPSLAMHCCQVLVLQCLRCSSWWLFPHCRTLAKLDIKLRGTMGLQAYELLARIVQNWLLLHSLTKCFSYFIVSYFHDMARVDFLIQKFLEWHRVRLESSSHVAESLIGEESYNIIFTKCESCRCK